MKSVILVCFFLVLIKLSLCQTVYYDAIKLRSLVLKKEVNTTTHDSAWFFSDEDLDNNGQTDIEQVYTILKDYTFNPSTRSVAQSDKEIDSLICGLAIKNEFLCPFFAIAPAAPTSVPSRILSAISNLDVTALADGLAQFLVERTKEELNEAFFRKFKDFLDEYPEFKKLFPNTNAFVNNFNSWEYSNLLNTLREAFDKDIKLLLANIVELRNLQDNDCPCKKKNDGSCEETTCLKRIRSLGNFFRSNEGRLFLSAFQIGNGILAGDKIPGIINSVSSDEFLLGVTINAGNSIDPTATANFTNSIKLINIISLSLQSNLTGKHYIGEDDFKLFTNDEVFQNLFLGLLYQRISNVNIQFNGIALAPQITPTRASGLRAYLTNLFEQSKNIQVAYDKLVKDKTEGKTDLGAHYGAIFESAKALLAALAQINIIDPSLAPPPILNDVLKTTALSLQVAHDISVRNYNASVVGVLKIFNDISEMPGVAAKYPGIRQFTAAFLKYGSFASNVVLSKDPDEVKEAINAFALPSGSSSIKKHTSFSISINAYTGFVYGFKNKFTNSTFTTQDVNGNDSIVKLNGGKSIAVYAPVGLSFNWGVGWQLKNPWSVSAFVSLIDIGAVVGYRFVTDTGQISQEFKINLGNIFAPGGNVIIGLPNMPLSVGGGAQWIPSLQRSPKSNEFYIIDHSGWRFQVFLAVDLPLLNIHTSKKSFLYAKQ
jgi:hypothetical protein